MSLQARILSKIPVGLVLASAAGIASAADDIDVSSLTPKMTAGVAAVATLGLAFLGVTVVRKLWGKLGG